MIVAGAPLDFRLRYGSFGPKDAARQGGARRRLARRPRGALPARGSAAGDLSAFFTALAERGAARRPTRTGCRGSSRPPGGRWPRTQPLLASDAEPVHPVRVYGELLKALDDDAVVIGDGGDFVSFAGRLVEPGQPGQLARPRSVRMPGHWPRLRGRPHGLHIPAPRSCCCSATAPRGFR